MLSFLKSLRESIVEEFPDLSDDENSIQHEWITKIDDMTQAVLDHQDEFNHSNN